MVISSLHRFIWLKSPISIMDSYWTPENFNKFLQSMPIEEFELSEGSSTLEESVREFARGTLRDWKTCDLYPIVGYYPELMSQPELIGVAAVGTPRSYKVSSVTLYAIEDHLPDKLIDWIDTVMEVGDGLDCVCEIMLAYHRAVIPVNGETLWDYENLFSEVLKGNRSTNHLKLKQWNKMPPIRTSTTLLHTNTIVSSDVEYTKSFREEWA